MARDNEISRRTAMKLTGAAAATALVAGCGGDDEGNGGNGNGNGNGNGDSSYDIDPGETIELEAQTSGWVGVAPSDIEDEENPTLVLQADEDYTIGWEEGDGSEHNIELRDDSDSVVEDYETEESSEGGDDQMIDFTATEEIVSYVCNPHESQMNGEIQVEDGNGGENGEENGEENSSENGEENGEENSSENGEENGEENSSE